MKIRSIIIFISFVFCSGCGTLFSHIPFQDSGDFDRGVYNGVRWDCHYAGPWVLDFPFSLAGDTLFLPLDIVSMPADFGEHTQHRPPFTNAVPDVSDEVLSNALGYYVVYGGPVESGRYISSIDFSNAGYIKSRPEVVITNIKSFSMNLPSSVLIDLRMPMNINWLVVGSTNRIVSAFSLTLFAKDAQTVAKLEEAYQTAHNFLFLLDNTPLGETYLDHSYGYIHKSRTIYLPLREHQDVLTISNALQRLVHN